MAYTVEGERLKRLREEEEALEAQVYGAEQEDKVLDDEEVVSPEESSEEEIELTDDIFSDETIPEDTTVKPNDDPGLVAQLRKELADANHRFNRFKGSSDITIRDLRTEVSSLHSTIAGLREETASLKSKGAESSSQDFDNVFTQEVRDVLGDEQVDAIRTVVERSDRNVKDIKDQFTKQQIEADRRRAEELSQANQNAFMNDLVSLVPDLVTMNNDPKFNEWLRHPGSDGIERLTRLREDQERMDSHRVAQFFIEYKNLQAKSTKKKVEDSVSNHIGPRGTQSSSSNNSADSSKKGFMKQSDINEFNRQVAKGKYKYESVKADAMEARIFKAMTEDKIIFDENPIN